MEPLAEYVVRTFTLERVSTLTFYNIKYIEIVSFFFFF